MDSFSTIHAISTSTTMPSSITVPDANFGNPHFPLSNVHLHLLLHGVAYIVASAEGRVVLSGYNVPGERDHRLWRIIDWLGRRSRTQDLRALPRILTIFSDALKVWVSPSTVYFCPKESLRFVAQAPTVIGSGSTGHPLTAWLPYAGQHSFALTL
ncbi:hypothetical protein BT96DRAFT_1004972 [Gymnopus androsaceus JB14]|uniref:Uncharacterized protein n=1 Tax=Gymnopus androsaceus JB14 TaxID=1447944 RepID=A0A6A4GQR9_9AGAR|nr:hypothetical protein BT96DRAFT_1004972 [Gymnopus androsaceus JB14]